VRECREGITVGQERTPPGSVGDFFGVCLRYSWPAGSSVSVCVCAVVVVCVRASVYRHHHRIFPLTSSSASTFFSLSPVHVRLLSSVASSSVGPVEWCRLVLLTAVPFPMLSDSRAVSTPLQLFGESVT
jgi:hypothetical protein